MKALFISLYDWANVGDYFAKALRSVEVGALSVIRHKHPYDYTTDSVRFNGLGQLQSIANKYDVLVYMHTELWKLNTEGKRVAAFHGGTRYRDQGHILVRQFNRVVDVTMIQTADLLGKGAKNEVWIFPPVDTDYLQPIYKTDKNPLVFGHYPRNMRYKGTRAVLDVLRTKRVNILFDGKVVPWKENMKRVSLCDVYVERMSLHRGPTYAAAIKVTAKDIYRTRTGVWGVAAMEAAALGKIVVTNDVYHKEYEREFGACPLLIANSPDELKDVVDWLKVLPIEGVLELQKKTREWVVDKHGFKAVGERLKEVLL
jgi:glycosyltransferase involved in cell wall biosynthesis